MHHTLNWIIRSKFNFFTSDVLNKIVAFIPITLGIFFWIYFTLQLFIVSGPYFLDAGLLGYNFSHGWRGAPQPEITQIMGGSQGSIRSQLQFHFYLFPSLLFGWIEFVIPQAAETFAAVLGIVALTSLFFAFVGYKIARNLFGPNASILSSLIAGLTGLSMLLLRPGSGSVGYPHVEFLGSGIMAAGLVLYRDRPKIAWLFITCGLLTREDMGFHLAALAIGVLLIEKNLCSSYSRKFWSRLMMLGIVFSVFQFIVKFFVGSGPNFLVAQFGNDWRNRFTFLNFTSGLSLFLAAHLALVLVYFGLYVIAKLNHDLRFNIPLISSLPWIIFNVFSTDPARQSLNTYFTFPLILGFAYLAVVNPRFSYREEIDVAKEENLDDNYKQFKIVPLTFIFAATIGMLASGPSGDYVSTLGLIQGQKPKVSEVYPTLESSFKISQGLVGGQSLVVDDAVLSLNPDVSKNLRVFDGKNLKNSDVVLFFPHYAFNSALIESLESQKFSVYCMRDSNLAFATRSISPYFENLTLAEASDFRPFC